MLAVFVGALVRLNRFSHDDEKSEDTSNPRMYPLEPCELFQYKLRPLTAIPVLLLVDEFRYTASVVVSVRTADQPEVSALLYARTRQW